MLISIYLSIYLSISVYSCLSVYLALFPSLSQYIYIYIPWKMHCLLLISQLLMYCILLLMS